MGSPIGPDAKSASAFRAYFVFIVIKRQQSNRDSAAYRAPSRQPSESALTAGLFELVGRDHSGLYDPADAVPRQPRPWRRKHEFGALAATAMTASSSVTKEDAQPCCAAQAFQIPEGDPLLAQPRE
jgi:hypothetical protein